MSQVLFVFRWYLVVQTFGLAVLPLCLILFRHLPDRGYGVSKPLGLLLTGWAFWLSTSFGWTRNTAGSVVVFLVLLAAAGLLLSFSSLSSAKLSISATSLSHWLRNRWRGVLAAELLFALAFLVWCLVRAYMPRIQTAGGEKWMEIAFLRAILRSDFFPPHDPWLSGFAISYYYFGYVIVAMITRLATVPPSIAFNLGIATLFSFTCMGAFSLVYNLIAMRTRSSNDARKSLKRGVGEEGMAIAGGLLGPLMVAVMGNLEGFLEVLHARGIGPASFWQWLDIRSLNAPPPPFAEGSCIPTRFFWWWQASRTLHDYAPWGAEQEVIDEFPVFSFILGDMHPHVLALPFVLLALVLALDLYVRIYRAQEGTEGEELRGVNGAWRVTDLQSALRAFRSFPFATWEFLIYALCLGGLGFLNTWDFPIYLFVVVAAYALACICAVHRALRIMDHTLRSGILFLSLFITGFVLYLPFWIGLRSQAGGLLLNLFNATRLPQFLVMFGPLVLVMIAFIAYQMRRSGVEVRAVVQWTLISIFSIIGVLILTLAVVVVLVWLGVSPLQGSTVYVAAWLRGEPIPGLGDVVNAHSLISSSLLSRFLNPWTALSLVAVLVTVILVLREGIGIRDLGAVAHGLRSTGRDFVLLLFATGALLTLGVEYVYLRDNFGVRMNTVFKFYFQAWVMWGIAGAYALAGFFRRDSAGNRVGVVAALVAVLLIAACLIYPALAIPARAREYGGSPTLDGAAYLAETKSDDYAAIAWLNANVVGAPVILEAPGDHFRAYVYEGRVSAHTGLPTLLGWAGHESQWRGNYTEQALREPDIETLYTSVDSDEVLTLLKKYSISYVYVGPLERERYPAAGLAKFASLMEPVYDTGAVTIYRMTDDESDQSSKSIY